MKKTRWTIWTVLTALLLLCGCSAVAQTQGDGAAALLQGQDFVSGIVQHAAVAHPWILGTLAVLALLRVAMKPLMSWVESICANDPAKEAAVKNFEASWWFHALCWLLDFLGSVKLKQTIVAATVCLMLMCALACSGQETQTIDGTQATPTVQGGVQQIWDAVKSGQTNWFGVAYGLYAPGLTHHYGGGVALVYPVSQYIVTGLRMDYVNGGFWMPSGNATLQVPIKINRWLTVTPFGYVGVGVPVSGATVAGVTLPGHLPKDNNGQVTAILGYGAAVHLFYSRGFFKSGDIVGDAETWSGFPGQQYRLGCALKF